MSVRKKRKIASKRRYYRRNYVTLVVVMLLFLVVTFYFLMFTNFFNIKTIQIIDNNWVDGDEILLKSGISKGDNIFRFNAGKVEESIEHIPYIKDADLVRVFPDEVKIYIQERQSICAVFYENKFINVDEEGIVLDYADNLFLTDIPLVTISSESVGSVVVGEQVQIQPDWVKNEVLKVLKIFEDEDILKYISELNVTEDKLFFLYTKGGSIIKVKNSEIVKNKIDFIRTYLTEKDERMIIDLTHEGNPTYIPRK